MMIRHALIAGCFLLTALPMAAVYGGPWIPDPNQWDPNGLWPLDWEELWEQYLARGPEVTPWLKAAGLPSPDNAALLYYQAFLVCPQRDDATDASFDDVLDGEEPDSKVRRYLGHCRETIQLAEMAGQMPQCTWGLSHPDGSDFTVPALGEVRQLTFVLAVDARTKAFDGYAQAALARCLTIRRLARHVGDDTITMFLLSCAVDSFAHHTMGDVLGIVSPDVDTLRWLRGQLAAVQGAPRSLERVLQTNFEVVLAGIRADPNHLEWVRQTLAEGAEDAQAREEMLSLTDDQIVARARRPYDDFQSAVFRVLDSDMPYTQKRAEIERLASQLEDEYGSDPAAWYAIFWSDRASMTGRYYSIVVRNIAAFHALKTAVEVYLVVAETGVLPEVLPDHTPKDPYSGEEFEYEVTEAGFILRCRVKDIDRDRFWEYEFIVK